MDRRSFFKQMAIKNKLPMSVPQPLDRSELTQVASAQRQLPTTTGLAPYSGSYGKKEIIHLLRRTLTGVSFTSYNHFKDLSLAAAVEELLLPTSAPSLPINDYNNLDYDILDATVPFGETWVGAAHGDNIEYWREISFKGWLTKQMIEQETSIHNKMILFWHNHLASEVFAIFDARLAYQQFEIFRTYALGNFKQMVKQITIDPQMLYYLNGTYNNKYQPDENYARELQELFCIGKGPDSGYTEDDVQAAARVLTGWRINWDQNTESLFDPWLHDTDPKQFSGFYNNTIINGQTGANGANELDQMLNMIFATTECAKFVCRKLYRFFVYHTIDATTESLVITPLANIFRDNNYNITPVLRALFKSEHFFDVANRGAMIKTPIDYLVGAFREFDIQRPDPSLISDNYELLKYMYWNMDGMLMGIGDPPNVAGWPAYYQAPSYNKYWVTTATLPSRALRTDEMLYWGYDVFGNRIKIDPVAITTQIPNAQDPTLLVNAVLSWMLAVPVSDTVKQNMKSELLSGQTSDYYWTDAWNEYLANPTDEMAYGTVESRLKSMYYILMHLEEYQLM